MKECERRDDSLWPLLSAKRQLDWLTAREERTHDARSQIGQSNKRGEAASAFIMNGLEMISMPFSRKELPAAVSA
jgi:hypothetical protein